MHTALATQPKRNAPTMTQRRARSGIRWANPAAAPNAVTVPSAPENHGLKASTVTEGKAESKPANSRSTLRAATQWNVSRYVARRQTRPMAMPSRAVRLSSRTRIIVAAPRQGSIAPGPPPCYETRHEDQGARRQDLRSRHRPPGRKPRGAPRRQGRGLLRPGARGDGRDGEWQGRHRGAARRHRRSVRRQGRWADGDRVSTRAETLRAAGKVSARARRPLQASA